METILTVLHVFLSVGLIALILIQHGKGADAGAAFGSGASATVFGSRGAANFLSRSTAALAVLFFVTSFALAWFSLNATEQVGLMAPVVEEPVAPEAAVVDSDLPQVPVESPAAAIPADGEVPAPETDVPAAPVQ
jgi:preprotein translocase subunit SecG